jgi:hypothetical protein
MEMEQLMERLLARIDANTTAMKEMYANMKSNQEQMVEKMDAETEAIRAETKAIQAKTKAMRAKRMEANGNAWRKGTTACHEAMEADTEKPSGMMQSVAEHQEAPKEFAIVKPVKGRKKRHKGRKHAVGRRGEPKELTRGIYAYCTHTKSMQTQERIGKRSDY